MDTVKVKMFEMTNEYCSQSDIEQMLVSNDTQWEEISQKDYIALTRWVQKKNTKGGYGAGTKIILVQEYAKIDLKSCIKDYQAEMVKAEEAAEKRKVKAAKAKKTKKARELEKKKKSYEELKGVFDPTVHL